MADYKYAYNGPEEGTAKAVLKGAAVSTKTAIELAKHLKGKTTEKAKALLERIITHEEALPYTRFTNGLGHKKGPMASGRYPEKAAKAFLQLLGTVEANASQAGLSSELKIIHLLAHQASRPYHYGRMRRRQVKASHVEVVVKEMEAKKKTAKKAETPKTEEKKPEVKKEAPKAEAPKHAKPAAAPVEKKEEAKPAPVEKKDAPKPEVKKEAPTLEAQPEAPKAAEKKPEPSQPTKETAQQ